MSMNKNKAAAINSILSTAPMKLVNETWVDKNTKKTRNLLVRSARLCPKCTNVIQVDLTMANCKNISCSVCNIWICLRCVTIVKDIADHETCCVRCKGGYHSGDCWCYDTGLQQIDDKGNITQQYNHAAEILNFIPQF